MERCFKIEYTAFPDTKYANSGNTRIVCARDGEIRTAVKSFEKTSGGRINSIVLISGRGD